jgi:hydrogenase maturation protease
MESGKNRTLVIGIGNEDRGDDSIGLWVARRLRERKLPGVKISEFRRDPTHLCDEWTHTDTVYLVDAMVSGAAPGTVRRMNITNGSPSRNFLRLSTHGAGGVDAVELARALNRMPRRLLLYGIEGSRFGTGAPISPEVESGAEQAMNAILEEIYGGEGAPQKCMSGD